MSVTYSLLSSSHLGNNNSYNNSNSLRAKEVVKVEVKVRRVPQVVNPRAVSILHSTTSVSMVKSANTAT